MFDVERVEHVEHVEPELLGTSPHILIVYSFSSFILEHSATLFPKWNLIPTLCAMELSITHGTAKACEMLFDSEIF